VKFRVALLIAMCAISLITHAQHQDSASVKTSPPPDTGSHLQTAGTSNSVPFSGGWGGKARCDDDGNIYVHLINAETGRQYLRASRSPISRIKPDETLGGAFRITDAGSDLSAIDFFVSGNGEVYQAASSKPDPAVYVIAFSKDGSVRSRKTALHSRPCLVPVAS